MRIICQLAAAAAVALPYHFDFARYFPTPSAEQVQRGELLTEVDAFAAVRPDTLGSPAAFLDWLHRRDRLLRQLRKHDLYLYLRTEVDTTDKADQDADDLIADGADKLTSATKEVLLAIDRKRLDQWMARDASLSTYRFFITSTLTKGAGTTVNASVAKKAATPSESLESLINRYKSLANQPHPPPADKSAEAAFQAKWTPYIEKETEYAGLLIPIVRLKDQRARARGFSGGPDAALARQGLTSRQLEAVLKEVSRSNANQTYEAVLAAAAVRRRGGSLHPWDLDEVDLETPADIAFPDAVSIILAAVKPMGPEYADQYERLFDPAAHRVELCQGPNCDQTGFSVGFAGLESGLFYGAYRGDTNSVRATAHEAGHAVHDQFMSENQPIADYNIPPKFMAESIAIFNELLLLDHLYKTAPSPALKAYYLHRFIADATFQVFGSAQEVELERSIYAGVRNGTLNDAADLDRLTLNSITHHHGPGATAPEMRVAWAQNRLYFTDPFYDTNYLFAGLLALEYFKRFEADPADFSRRYVALLKTGFDETPQMLEKRILGLDLDDAHALVGDASALIDARSRMLARLYEAQSRRP